MGCLQGGVQAGQERDRGGPDAWASGLAPSHPGYTATLRRPAGAAGPSPAGAECGHAALSCGPASAWATGAVFSLQGCCRANVAQIRPESGLGVQVKILKTSFFSIVAGKLSAVERIPPLLAKKNKVSQIPPGWRCVWLWRSRACLLWTRVRLGDRCQVEGLGFGVWGLGFGVEG